MNGYKKYIKGLKNQLSVVDALVYRELLTKKNYSFLGFLGVIIEPLLITFVYLIILKLIRANIDIGLDPILFFGTGILLFSFFASILNRSSNAIKANRNLFYYKKVKPIDTIIARSLIEISLLFIVYSLILVIVFYIKNEIILDNFPKLLLIFILVTILSFSAGLIFIMIINKFEFSRSLIPLISRPLFFTSGAIFSINIVPYEFRNLLLWNPLLHAIEIARNSLDSKYELNDQISLAYLSFTTLIIFGKAIFNYMRNERYLLRKWFQLGI